MKHYLMGLDFGTQGVRCGIFDQDGALAAVQEAKYETIYPRPGWTEQRPEDWETCLGQAIAGCYAQVGNTVFRAVQGMAVCATSSTVVAIGRDDRACQNAILWMDNRAKEQAERINATGHPVLRYCGGEDSVEWLVPKMLWIKQNQPEVYRQAVRIAEQQDVINHFLTGEWKASVSQATCKANYVEELGGFDQSFFDAIELGEFAERANTEVLEQGMLVGTLRPALAEAYHLPGNIPVYQGGIDAHVNMLGLGVCCPGDMGVVMGTSFVHLASTDRPIFAEGTWGPYKSAIVPGQYCLEGGQVSAGSITKWFLREFGIVDENPYGKMAAEAKGIPAGCEGVVALDFFQGNRTPYKDPQATGVFMGMTLSHTRAHLYRAVLESVAFGTRNIIGGMERSGLRIHALMGCGGVTFNEVWLQIISDVSGKPIILTQQSGNAGVLGCAIIAAVGSGVHPGFASAAKQMVHVTRQVQPSAVLHEEYQPVFEKYLKLYQNLKDLMR